MSLRSRLLLVVLVLVALALGATNVVTYRALRSFLFDRIDQQLEAAREPVSMQLFESGRRGSRPVSEAVIPSGTYAAVLSDDGLVINAATFTTSEEQRTDTRPAFEPDDVTRAGPFSVDSTSGSVHYRAEVSRLYTEFGPTSRWLLIAIPLKDVTQTLHRLIVIEALATGIGLLLVGAAALWLVRAGLRPLDDIAEVAGAIAAGDLSKRVPRAESRTEVGRLGLSLNAMLGQIQAAFEARQASESRLRRFIADASHELRTPLTSIRGYAELFRRGAAERPDDLAKAMRRIEEEASRMGLLVDDLLLLARLDQGRPLERDDVDLARVAADAVDDARAAAPERPISLEAPQALVVVGDEARLRQVAANLVANACQHTPPEAAVEVRVRPEGGMAVLEVADHGPGIPPEHAGRVFERFYRADPSRTRAGGGSGLGLSIVAAIAAAHGGEARIATAPGTGACFSVTIPLAPSANGADPPTSDGDREDEADGSGRDTNVAGAPE